MNIYMIRIFIISTLFISSFLFARGPFEDIKIETKVRNLFEEIKPAFVFISSGSGVVISKDGLLLTNYHVINNLIGKDLLMLRLGNGKSYKARILGFNKNIDIALLRIQSKDDLPYLELGNSDLTRRGDTVVVMGNPLGLGGVDKHPSYSCGIVTARPYLGGGSGKYLHAILSNAAINPGNSGGPLVSLDAKVIGINTFIITRWGFKSNTGVGAAIPSRQIQRWLPRLKSGNGKNVAAGNLQGLQFDKEENHQKGIRIASIQPGSSAERFGLQVGDWILSVDQKPIFNNIRFHEILRTYPGKGVVLIAVQRKENIISLSNHLD